MKGLIIKDFCSLFKQLRIMLLVIVVWCCLPNLSMAGFAIVFSAMLPITALAYDERSKWDQLAVMMPYSPTALPLSKYIMGYILVLAMAVFSCLVRAVFVALGIFGEGLGLFQFALYVCAALTSMAVILPMLFKLGTEKGRILYIIIMCAAGLFSGTLASESLNLAAGGLSAAVLLPAALLVTAGANLLSIAISIGVWKRRC